MFYCLWCAHARVFTYVVSSDVRMCVCLGAYFALGVRVYVGLCARVCTSIQGVLGGMCQTSGERSLG